MPYPSVFRRIKKGNFRVTPFKVHKQWLIDNNTVTSSYGHTIQQATHRREKTPIGRTTLTTFGNNFDQAGKIVEIGSKANNDPRNLDVVMSSHSA